MGKKTFDDLKEAIIEVLLNADQIQVENMCLVPIEVLQTLQSEYNIYFVEPDQPQVDIL